MADVTSIYGNPIKDAVARADISTLQTDVQDVKDGLSDLEASMTDTINSVYVTDTASGAIASFPDGADGVPVKSLTVDIEPVQDLHGQANPYPAGGGKNKLHVTAVTQTSNGVTFTVNEDGTVKVNGTATANTYLYLGDSSLSALAEGMYILSGSPSGGAYASYGLQINDGSWKYDYGSGASFTKGSTLTSVAIRIANGYTANNLLFKPMIRLASVSDATFAPYSNICPITGHASAVVTVSPTTDAQDGTSYTIDLDGTRYGGTLDVTTGVLTVTHTHVDENAFGSVSSGTNAGGLHWVDTTTAVFDADKSSYCSMLTRKDGDAGWLSTSPCYAMDTNKKIRVYCEESTTALFKSAYADLQIVCGLINPTTVQLTAEEVTTLLGQNNIWNDCGDTTVEYRADTKLYIQKVINS